MLLYAITDRRQWAEDEAGRRRELLRRVAEAARAGVDFIQLREKDLSGAELERLAAEVLRVVRDNSASTRLLVNSRLDVALAVDADGVHLAGGAMTAGAVRAAATRAGRSAPLTISSACHAVGVLSGVRAEGCDLALLSPIFEKPGATLEGLGLQALQAARGGGIRVLALGGVNVANADACLRAGADGVAGIRLFFDDDAAARIRRLRALG